MSIVMLPIYWKFHSENVLFIVAEFSAFLFCFKIFPHISKSLKNHKLGYTHYCLEMYSTVLNLHYMMYGNKEMPKV